MQTIVENASVLFEGAMTNLQSVATTVTGSPILMVGIILPLAFVAIGVFRRLLNL